MDKFLVDIKHWVRHCFIFECKTNSYQDFYHNRHSCRFVLEENRNILAFSKAYVFYVIVLKDEKYKMEDFFRNTKIPCRTTCGFRPREEKKPDIIINDPYPINPTNKLQMNILHQALEYTIGYFCEEKWNEIGGSRGDIYSQDFNYLWASSYLFDSDTPLVPTIEMKLIKNASYKFNECTFEMKPLIMKKFPLEHSDDIKINQIVYTIPRLTEGVVQNIFEKDSNFEEEQYYDTLGHWTQTWGIQRPDYSECRSRRFVNINIKIAEDSYHFMYHVSCLFSKKPEPIECKPEDEEAMKLYAQFIDKFKECLIRIGYLPIVESIQ